MMRYTRHVPSEVMDGMQPPMEGLSIEITEDCSGCGLCMSKCYIQAIEMKGGQAVIGPKCRICGRCAARCPEKAIQIKYDNEDLDDFFKRIDSSVAYK